MYRILIVDDERIIVDGLSEMLKEKLDAEIEVYKAYSAPEALEWLDRIRIDIVLTDIRMPEMTGLELQQAIVARWPRCKVVFLTGYHDPVYIQASVRNGAIDYVLKTEGDPAIRSAIEKAIKLAEEEVANSETVVKAKAYIAEAIPVLRNEYFLALLEGQESREKSRSAKFRELAVALDPGLPVYCLAGRIDEWNNAESPSDKALYMYAVNNILEEFLAGAVKAHHIVYERNRSIWLMQPPAEDRLAKAEVPDWSNWIRYIRGSVEQIQTACKQVLKLPCSFIAAEAPTGWESLATRFRALDSMFLQGIGLGTELFLTDGFLPDGGTPGAGSETERSQAKRVQLLEKYLDEADRDAYFEMFRQITKLDPDRAASSIALELYYSIVAMIFSYLNRWSMMAEVTDKIPLQRLVSLDSHSSWDDARRFLEHVSEHLFERKMNVRNKQIYDIVKRLHDYIESHLSGDLSLARLAELVYLAPSYLSRFYKQTTGKGISEHIADTRLHKAKELLLQPHLKIHEIGLQVGFPSAPYFTRFFRKMTSLSPQEFRDLNG
ncbi:response regulator transcription factor [Paenibacillus koleovorans]|uniref:response regulator transcription factor n=1 Tax=Paenibacillus koleovorans TaxID=121608 RepID=UPI000FD7A661|nr:response regulator [Paenibacillus koleovorans]